MKIYKRYSGAGASLYSAGFTLLEMLVVVLIIGVLSAIAAPGWLGFVNRQRLNTSQNQVLRVMYEAQSNAKRDKVTWQASFQEVNNVVQWTVHRAESGVFIPAGVRWNNLGENIRIDKDKNDKGDYETTLDTPGVKTPNGPWRVQFNYHGNTNGSLGRIALKTADSGKIRRCVIVSTLIGNLRTGKEHPKANDGKYCY